MKSCEGCAELRNKLGELEERFQELLKRFQQHGHAYDRGSSGTSITSGPSAIEEWTDEWRLLHSGR